MSQTLRGRSRVCSTEGRGKKGKAPVRNVAMLVEVNPVTQEEDAAQEEESGENTPTMLGDQETLIEESRIEEVQTEAWGASWIYDYDINATRTCAEIYLSENKLVDRKAEPSETAVPELVIDSGAAITVDGREWIRQWYAWENQQGEIPLNASNRKFRFGSGKVYDSLGTTELKAWSWAKRKSGKSTRRPISIVCDVADLPIPLLVSLQMLRTLNCAIHFGEGPTIWGDLSETPLRITVNKHLTLPWYPKLKQENPP